MPTPLVLLVGEAAHGLAHATNLVRAGAVVVLAPTLVAARDWLAEAAANGSADRDREVLSLGELEVDRRRHEARWRGSALALTSQELQILATLAEDPGRAISFEDLFERAWNGARFLDPGPVRAAIRRLRGKLAASGARVEIEPVRGVGFRLSGTDDSVH